MWLTILLSYLVILLACCVLWHLFIVSGREPNGVAATADQLYRSHPHMLVVPFDTARPPGVSSRPGNLRHGGGSTALNTFADLEAVVCSECPDCACCRSVFVGETPDECALGHGRCECLG